MWEISQLSTQEPQRGSLPDLALGTTVVPLPLIVSSSVTGFLTDDIPNWTVVKYCAVPYVSSLSEDEGRRLKSPRELSDAMSALLYNLGIMIALRIKSPFLSRCCKWHKKGLTRGRGGYFESLEKGRGQEKLPLRLTRPSRW